MGVLLWSGVEVCKNDGRSEEATLRIVDGDADEAVLSIGNMLLIFNFFLSLSLGNGFAAERGVDSNAKEGTSQVKAETFALLSVRYLHACWCAGVLSRPMSSFRSRKSGSCCIVSDVQQIPTVCKTIYLQLEVVREIGPAICRPVPRRMAAA